MIVRSGASFHLAAEMARQMISLILSSISPILDRSSGNCFTTWQPFLINVLDWFSQPEDHTSASRCIWKHRDGT